MKDVFESALKKVKQPAESSWQDSDARGMSPLKIPDDFKPPRQPKAPTVTKEPSIPKATTPSKPAAQPTFTEKQVSPGVTPKATAPRLSVPKETPVNPQAVPYPYMKNPKFLGRESSNSRLTHVGSSLVNSSAASVPLVIGAGVQGIKDSIADLNNPEVSKKRQDLTAVQNEMQGLMARGKAYTVNEARQRVPTAEYAQLQAQETVAKEQLDAVKTQTPLAPDAPGMELMQQSVESRQKALEGLNPTQSFLLNTGMSIADSASTLPLAAVNPSLPLIAMGAKAAAGKTYELTQQGVGAGEAFGRGLVSGAIEAATEKIPLDELLGIMKHSAKGFKEFAKATLKQMGIEATEESVSYIANYVADKAAKDPNAVFDIKELALSMAAGGLSGMVFGSAFGSYKAGVDNYNQVQAQKVAERQAVADYMAQGNAIRRNVGEVGIGANSRSVRPGIIFDIADNQVSSVNAYIERAAENRNGDEALLPYGYLQEEEAIELSALLGKDISGYRHAIRDNDIRHLLSNKDNSIEDLKQIPSIVKNADIKFLGKPTKPYADNQTLSGNQTIYYVKRHNGTTYYLEQVLDGEKVLATKQFKKIPTGTIPAFIHKLPLDEATKQTIVQKIKELSNPYHANVPTDVVPREHVQNEPIRKLNNPFAPTIAKSQRDVNIRSAQSIAAQPQPVPGTNITYTLDKQADIDAVQRQGYNERRTRNTVNETPQNLDSNAATEIDAIPLGESQPGFSKSFEEMTPEEFERVVEMAERGELMADADDSGAHPVKLQDVGLTPILVTPQAIDRVPYVESLYFEPNELRAMYQALLQEAMRFPLDIEVVRSYTMDGQLLLQREGERGTVKLNVFDEPYFAMHNHPDTNTFSKGDIESFIKAEYLLGLSVVGNNGRTYLLEKTSEYNKIAFINYYLDCKEWISMTDAVSFVKDIEKTLRGASRYGVRYIVG